MFFGAGGDILNLVLKPVGGRLRAFEVRRTPARAPEVNMAMMVEWKEVQN